MSSAIRRRIRAFFDEWGDIAQVVIGGLLVVLAAGLIVLALNYKSDLNRRAEVAKETQAQARKACVRTRYLAPILLDFYKSFAGTDHAIPPRIIASYEATIPKECTT